MRFKNHRNRMTRVQFEKMLKGTFKSVAGDRYRTNGQLVTFVRPGQKYLRFGPGKDGLVYASTWFKLYQFINKALQVKLS